MQHLFRGCVCKFLMLMSTAEGIRPGNKEFVWRNTRNYTHLLPSLDSHYVHPEFSLSFTKITLMVEVDREI